MNSVRTLLLVQIYCKVERALAEMNFQTRSMDRKPAPPAADAGILPPSSLGIYFYPLSLTAPVPQQKISDPLHRY